MAIRHIVLVRFLALWVALAALLVSQGAKAGISNLDTLEGYDSSSGYAYGLPSSVGHLIAPVDDDLVVTDKDFPSIDARGQSLGCAALSYEALTGQVLEGINTTLFEDALNSEAANYYRSTVYNSPALATEFSGLMDMASRGVEFIQRKCAASDVTGVAKQIQSQAVISCVKRVMNSRSYADEDAVAEAYRVCLLNPSADHEELVEEGVNAISSVKWTGSLHDALARTNFCNSDIADEDKKCSLLAFVPDYKWCPGQGVGENGDCAGDGGKRYAPPRISSQTVFDSAFYIARNIVTVYVEFAELLALSLSDIQELSNSLDASFMYRTADAPLVVTDLGNELESHLTCSNQILSASGIPDFVSTARQPDNLYSLIETYSGDNTEMAEYIENNNLFDLSSINSNELISELTPGAAWTTPLTVVNSVASPYDGGAVSTTDYLVKSGDVSKPAAFELIPISVICAMRDNLKLSLYDYALIANNKNDQQAAVYALSFYIAQYATEQLLSFVQNKLQNAYAEMQFDNVIDPKGFPEHTVKTLSVLMDEMDRKVAQLQSAREKRKGFANLLLKVTDEKRGY